MSIPRTTPGVLLAACGLLAACDGGAPASAPALARDGRIEWHGTLPCADCDAIEVQLMLEREGHARRYELVETFVADEGAVRFAESGQWKQEDDLIDLTADGGVARRYAVLADGRLQPRDSRGRAFARREGDALMPARASGP